MVLAFLLLELRHDLCEHRLLLHHESARLNLGEHEEARPSKDAQRMKKLRPGLNRGYNVVLLFFFFTFRVVSVMCVCMKFVV